MLSNTSNAHVKNVQKVINSFKTIAKDSDKQSDKVASAMKSPTWQEVHKGSFIAAEMMFKSYLRVAMQHGLVARFDGAGFNTELKQDDRVVLLVK